jgi:FtsZ-binding cell division protein ZapB
MRQSFFERYAKVLSGILLVLLLLEANHSRNQSQDIASLNDSITSAIAEIDELSAQVDELQRSNRELISDKAELQAENDRLVAAARLNALNSLGLGRGTFSSSGATGRCNDGTETFAVNRQGACSWHGGVDYWY